MDSPSSRSTSFRASRLGRGWHLASIGAGCRGFAGPVPSASLDVSGRGPLSRSSINGPVDLLQLVRREALEASRATPHLTDAAVSEALAGAAALVRERRRELLAANEADCEAAAGRLDEGTLDRLRLDEKRVGALAEQVETMAAIPPLEREISSWTLPNGLAV